MRRFAALAVGCALICPNLASASPFTVARLLALEELGPVRLDPSRRWLVVQRYERLDRAPTFDLDSWAKLGLGRVQVFDVSAGGTERQLDLPPGVGYSALGVSPGGRYLAVGRLSGHAYELGVVDLSTGQARWLDVSPRQPVWGPSVLWRSDEEILVAARPPTFPDAPIGYGFMGRERIDQQWVATARGELGATVIGSGRFRDLRPKPPAVGLVAINLTTGARRTVIEGTVRDFDLAPGGKMAAAVIEGEDIQLQSAEPTNAASEPTRKRLILADLDTGETRDPCPDCDVMGRFLSFSHNGQKLLMFARQGDVPFVRGRYWTVGLKGPARPLDLGRLSPALGASWDQGGLPLGGWLDGDPVVFARAAPGGRTDFWRVGDGAPRNLTETLPSTPRMIGADPHVWAVQAGDEVWRVTGRDAAPWGVNGKAVQSLATPPAGFRGSMNFVPVLKDLALTDAAARPLTPWPGPRLPGPVASVRVAGLLAQGPVTVTKDDHGVERVGLTSPSGEIKVLATINASLDEIDFSTPTPLRHKGVDGREVTSWLYRPPGAPDGARLPVVVLPYPGASSASPPAASQPGVILMSANAQVLAAHGYAVIEPAMPYWQGHEPIEGLADQILAPVDAAAAQGLVDPARVAVWGHSYGGYAALGAAAQTQRFKAVIATAATNNLLSAYARLGPINHAVPEYGLTVFASTGWQETGQARMGVPPWKDPGLYQRNSPITYVDKITAPVLMFHGDNDKGLDQAQAVFGALYRQNKDAVLVTYRGEGHIFYSPANVRDYFQRVLDLLDWTIGPGQEATH